MRGDGKGACFQDESKCEHLTITYLKEALEGFNQNFFNIKWYKSQINVV